MNTASLALVPFLLVAAVGCEVETVGPPPATPLEQMSVRAEPGGCVAVVAVARGSEAHVRCTDGGEATIAQTAAEPPASEPIETLVPAPRDPAPSHGLLATSSTYPGWPASNATDGDLGTSWFSQSNDSAAKGKAPFFEVRFPEAHVVHRVEVMGNRDPSWPKGFTILAGELEVFDAHDHLLVRKKGRGAGEKSDFRFDLGALEGVERVRFTSLEDEGDQNAWGDVAISEFIVR